MSLNLASAAASPALSSATALSSMALASAAVPNCWAEANATPQNNAAAVIADANVAFLILSSPGVIDHCASSAMYGLYNN